MWRWLVLVILAGQLVVPPVAWVADEACAVGVGQCSREIDVTTANSIVTLNMRANNVCVFNASGSANTVYVMFINTVAQADGDVSHPIAPDRHVCLNNIMVTHVHVIADAAGETTAHVLAFP